MTQFESAIPPQRPEVSQLGEIYTLKWRDKEIQMRVERFDTDTRKNVTAEITVEVLDTPVGEGHIARGRQGLLSTFRTLIQDCVDFGGELISNEDWRIMFKQLSNAVLDKYRMGEPAINLSQMGEVGKKPFILEPFIYEGNPTVIYGRGGVGKSLFCLYLAVLLQTGTSHNRLSGKKMNVLYLDYEADPDESKYRSNMIAHGLEVDPDSIEIHYRHCSVPFREEADVIQRIVMELEIGCVVIDSAVPAVGDAISGEAVSQFFNSVRSLSTSERQVASLIIGHTTKAQEDKNSSGPYGAAHWRNGPRTVWHFKADQKRGADTIDVQLIHDKVNLDKLLAPIGFQIEWRQGAIHFLDLDARRHSVFGRQQHLGDRIEVALEDNSHLAEDALATLLDARTEDIRTELDRDTRFIQNTLGEWELMSI